MRERKELIDYGPHLFAVIGAGLILFAVYVAGSDELTCARQGSQFNCQFVSRRLLSLVVLGRQDIRDVIGLLVRSTSGPLTEEPFDHRLTPSLDNHALVLRTRQGEDVPTLGGDPAFDFATEFEALQQGTDTKPITNLNSYWPVAAGSFGLGVAFALLGGIAIFKD